MKKAHNASIVKKYAKAPVPAFLVQRVNEFVDLLYWELNRILDKEGISMLQWAFIQRAYDCRAGVSFKHILEVTGESKDNVRRAANRLKGFAEVVIEPRDRRARRLVLTPRGRKRVGQILIQFQREILELLGARDETSERAREFRSLLFEARAFLAPGDLADAETVARSKENLRLFPDTSLQFIEDKTLESMWIAEDRPDDWIPW